MDYLHAMADHYLRTGQMEKAREIAKRMKEKHPDNQLGHHILSFIEKSDNSGRAR